METMTKDEFERAGGPTTPFQPWSAHPPKMVAKQDEAAAIIAAREAYARRGEMHEEVFPVFPPRAEVVKAAQAQLAQCCQWGCHAPREGNSLFCAAHEPAQRCVVWACGQPRVTGALCERHMRQLEAIEVESAPPQGRSSHQIARHQAWAERERLRAMDPVAAGAEVWTPERAEAYLDRVLAECAPGRHQFVAPRSFWQRVRGWFGGTLRDAKTEL